MPPTIVLVHGAQAARMAVSQRAGTRRAVRIPGASHAVLVSHPEETAHLIFEAAASRVAA